MQTQFARVTGCQTRVGKQYRDGIFVSHLMYHFLVVNGLFEPSRCPMVANTAGEDLVDHLIQKNLLSNGHGACHWGIGDDDLPVFSITRSRVGCV